MPFKSQAQRRLFYAKARRGEMSPGMVKEWEEATPKGRKLPEKVKTAEPPPPEGVSAKEWDKRLGYVRDRVREGGKPKTSQGDWTETGPTPRESMPPIRFKLNFKKQGDLELEDPTRLMPYLRAIHKMGAALLTKEGYTLQGHTNVQGLKVSIENRKGSVRKGKDSDGHEWRTKMIHPYGYLTGTRGADDEPVDAYVGPDKNAPDAYVVHQHKDDGTGYDEDKVMLGFKSKKDAKEGYLKHYDDPKFLGPISRVSVERLKELVASKKRLVKISQVAAMPAGPAAEQQPAPQIAVRQPQPVQEAVKRREQWRLARKAGPALGGLLGAGVGAALGAHRGKLLRGLITGLGTGATLGWTPDMYASAREGLRRYRRKVGPEV